jgi:hypothetical protein
VRGSDRLRAWCAGFSLHAGVVIAAHDRAALERLCRYGARPAFAHDRLAWTADGRVSYQLKRPWPDGRTHLVLEPVTFLRRLVGIIPPPRRHLVRQGSLNPWCATRGSSARSAQPARSSARWCLPPTPPPRLPAQVPPQPVPPRAHRLPWAELLRRVFAHDVLACPSCTDDPPLAVCKMGRSRPGKCGTRLGCGQRQEARCENVKVVRWFGWLWVS